jgi:hypothetical protein
MRNRIDVFPLVFDLQLFALDGDNGDGGDGGADNGDGIGGTAKFVEKKDPVTGKVVKIPADFESVIGHFISATRNETKTETEKKYQPLVQRIETLQGKQEELETVRAELEKVKQANMTAEEIAQANAKKKIAEHELVAKTATEEAKTWKDRFEKTMIKNDIFASFGGVELCNAKQTAILFETEGRAKISEKVDQDGKPTGEFETRMTLELADSKGNPVVNEGTPDELFKKWITLDRNSHHRKNMIPSGGNSRTTTKADSKRIDITAMEGLDPKEKLNRARGVSENKR